MIQPQLTNQQIDNIAQFDLCLSDKQIHFRFNDSDKWHAIHLDPEHLQEWAVMDEPKENFRTFAESDGETVWTVTEYLIEPLDMVYSVTEIKDYLKENREDWKWEA